GPPRRAPGGGRMRVLVIDNYDSFVYNLYQAIGQLGAEPSVHRNDGITLEEVQRFAPDAIVLSPGPGRPTNERDFGVCAEILRELSPSTPTLGVCLGHQGIGTSYGGTREPAARIRHGEASVVRDGGRPIFGGLPKPVAPGR